MHRILSPGTSPPVRTSRGANITNKNAITSPSISASVSPPRLNEIQKNLNN